MFSRLWGRITGADKRKALPDQQASVLGRLGDYIVVYPYGSYCDLPDDVWLRVIDEGVVIPVTSDRPDTTRGEPVFFHPVTGAKVHFKNNGDIDIITSADVNVSCENANITCTTKAIVTAPDIELTGNVKITGNFDVIGNSTFAGTILNNGKDIGDTHGHAQANDSGGNS